MCMLWGVSDCCWNVSAAMYVCFLSICVRLEEAVNMFGQAWIIQWNLRCFTWTGKIELEGQLYLWSVSELPLETVAEIHGIILTFICIKIPGRIFHVVKLLRPGRDGLKLSPRWQWQPLLRQVWMRSTLYTAQGQVAKASIVDLVSRRDWSARVYNIMQKQIDVRLFVRYTMQNR